MQEKRREDRYHLIHYLRIFDRNSGEELGNLVNVNSRGIMFISGKPIETGKLLRLRMDFPEDIAGRYYIEFDARSVWVQTDINPDLYAMGLEVTHISDADLEVLKYVIDFYND